MAIKGSLKEASLPDVIQLLHLGRRTGCLAVADRQSFGSIYFDEGYIVYASLVNRRDRLGDLLVRSGRVTAAQLQAAVDRQADLRDRKLGELLVQAGHLTREELETYMRLQIEEAVYTLFTWSQGTFNFEAAVRPDGEDFLVRISPEFLLLEGARRVDEWSLIEAKIPSLDVIFTADLGHARASGLPLSDEQERLLPLLDGTRDVAAVIEQTGLSEFEAGKAIYGLITSGIVHRTGTSAAAPVLKVPAARVEEHRNLGVAFYRAGMLEDAEREFRRVAELRPNDGAARFHLGLVALRQERWTDAAEAFRTACEVGGVRASALHNLAYALERQGRFEEAAAAYGEAAGRARDDARILLGWAVAALRRDDVTGALGRLARVRELLGDAALPPLWYWADALAHGLRGDAGEALHIAARGTAAHPAHPVLLQLHGVLLEAAGDLAGAERVLRDALQREPGIPQISKALGDVLYRVGRHDEAHAEYQRAATLAPTLGDDLHFKLGNIAFKQQNRVAARAAWQQALSINPAHAQARRNLAALDATGG
jgi:Flp pilus assembly protein TadD